MAGFCGGDLGGVVLRWWRSILISLGTSDGLIYIKGSRNRVVVGS